MKSSSERPTVICPKSGAEHELRRNGKTICGTQVYLCTVCRKVYTLIDAYNKFGEAKRQYRIRLPNSKGDLPFSLFDYL